MMDSSALSDMMALYLAEGGAVKEVPVGATANPEGKQVTFTKTDENERKVDRERRVKRKEASVENDLALVTRIHAHKAQANSNSALCRELTITNDRLQRILARYLPKDPSVDRFRAMGREERLVRDESELLERIRRELASGTTGVVAIGAICGASAQRVTAIAKKHKLVIPRGEPVTKLAAGEVGIPIGQLDRWLDYLSENRISEVEREIRDLLSRSKATRDGK